MYIVRGNGQDLYSGPNIPAPPSPPLRKSFSRFDCGPGRLRPGFCRISDYISMFVEYRHTTTKYTDVYCNNCRNDPIPHVTGSRLTFHIVSPRYVYPVLSTRIYLNFNSIQFQFSIRQSVISVAYLSIKSIKCGVFNMAGR
jgi:hypothetical protein